MDKEDFLEIDTLNETYDVLNENFKVISQDYEDQKSKTEEIINLQEKNEFLQDSLLLKFKKFTNFMTESCLIQSIAVLFCILVILLLKL